MGKKLASGDQFSEVVINTVQDGDISLPKAIDLDFAVVIFYRGHW